MRRLPGAASWQGALCTSTSRQAARLMAAVPVRAHAGKAQVPATTHTRPPRAPSIGRAPWRPLLQAPPAPLQGAAALTGFCVRSRGEQRDRSSPESCAFLFQGEHVGLHWPRSRLGGCRSPTSRHKGLECRARRWELLGATWAESLQRSQPYPQPASAWRAVQKVTFLGSCVCVCQPNTALADGRVS